MIIFKFSSFQVSGVWPKKYTSEITSAWHFLKVPQIIIFSISVIELLKEMGKKNKAKNNTEVGKTIYPIIWSFPQGADTLCTKIYLILCCYPRQAAVTVGPTIMFLLLFSALSQIFWSLLRWNILMPSTFLLRHPIKVQLSGKSPRQFHYAAGWEGNISSSAKWDAT